MTTIGMCVCSSSPVFKATSTAKRLKLNLPKRPDRDHELIFPLPFHYFLIRGIVPMIATNPEQRFNWCSPTNTRITRRHAASKTVLASIESLIRSGRRYRGKTPGITIETRKGRAIRYEYWPLFDEHVDENEWRPTWPRKEAPPGKEMSKELALELVKFFYRPAHIPETVDF